MKTIAKTLLAAGSVAVFSFLLAACQGDKFSPQEKASAQETGNCGGLTVPLMQGRDYSFRRAIEPLPEEPEPSLPDERVPPWERF